MRLYKTNRGIVVEENHSFYLTPRNDWDTLVNRDDLHSFLIDARHQFHRIQVHDFRVLPPIQSQEVWAAGVTYQRSREARMEEARQNGGGGDFYAKVYEAERPELFFKATAARVAGTLDFVRIRRDASWSVPEPELVLFITSSGRIAGYTIGNDMSSRDIEGQNPLYLPQANCYDGATAIGPCLYVPSREIDPSTEIEMTIIRKERPVFDGRISIRQMKRTHQELVDYLFREMTFPHGVYLMTGTCLVPPTGLRWRSLTRFAFALHRSGRLRIQ